MRKIQIQEEMVHVRSKPEILDYPLKSPRTPVHLRDTTEKPYDLVLKNLRDADPARYVDHMKECTFSPRLNRSRSGRQ